MQQHQISLKKGTPIRCPHDGCGYNWTYSGRFFIYATCPSCHKNIKINDNKVESPLQSVTVGGHKQIAAVENTSTPIKEPTHYNG
jgi:uncharacterized protein (DUF983 family)